ncbi:2-amino-4-hydroxy-6-hydroxymethyldihydropteridine diphosphokinase [Nitrospirillum sp. BR 11163]|uniref:2-amino-4-hydroxy-6- hydroxymethyldihydropteridine diphosphokinase n=1 Tax=Nitrospirillum sp. BR 11163 TaxID=3104323 RepID=UPI002AFFA010|nr:2-amino-4-hydroxy-6-hydroxymethyldihydropteridine diphosphokinase [Nitrospirillum sp. BR 11163]MEA1676268.1 2-amino-4-hydroxy-6-hydroxymethyldihydropteridine diphosphokinase [Nitrospirillum sp. BR 11163]
MILVGVGSNLSVPGIGGPRDVVAAAVRALGHEGLTVAAVSPWYRSAPVPVSDQPWYVNGVLRVETGLDAPALLAVLHRVEAAFGRVRRQVNEARGLDLDLLAYHAEIRSEAPVLPHPRMDQRAFVLLPLRDIAPAWRHPVSGLGMADLVAGLPAGQVTERIAGIAVPAGASQGT